MIRLLILLLLSLSVAVPARARDNAGLLSEPAARAAVTANNFMIAAAEPRAVEAGYRVLQDGGSAVDAAIAAQLVLGLVEPQSSGLGGGAFLLHYRADRNDLTLYDGRETAPAAATPGLFLDADGKPLTFLQAVIGGRSVGTPGIVRLLAEAHARHGRLPWPHLFQPAIALAERGFAVSALLARNIAEDADNLRRYPATAAYFLRADGAPLPEGAILRNPAYAEVLRAIADQGADAFYHGPIARDMVRAVHEVADNPGRLAESDLTGYRIAVRQPVCGPYREYRVCSAGPPSSGGLTVLQILGLLQHFRLAGQTPLSVDAVHLFAEAGRLAFADRALYMADADFVPMPTAGLIDPVYLTVRSQLIDRSHAIPNPTPGNPPWRDARVYAPDRSPELPSTSHLSVVDRDGNIVSMTTTIEAGFGSRVMARGFLLNNELTDFSFAPETDGRPVANRVEPGKRPRSSMSPAIVFDRAGKPVLVVGSAGGSRIIGHVARTIVAVLDWGLAVNDAVALPHTLTAGNNRIELERGTPAEALKPALEARGHTVDIRPIISGLHAIGITDGRLTGGADPRREGTAMGD